ncbi:MAG: DUF1015 domain-containing protein [Bacteroidia bacterium]|nr:DUF1015 domain-containing protein [Bacteroidia bacterium]
MAAILPFKGVLPQKNLADKLVTLSADNYSIEEVKKIIEKNHLSYLSIIYPDFIDNQKTPPHSVERFNKIYNRFHLFLSNQYFIQDPQPAYYIYRQKHAQFEFNGIIAAISTEDYWKGNIKIHEQTLSEREKKLKDYLKHCKVNAEPVLFFYPKNQSLSEIINTLQNNHPDIEVHINGVQHLVWKSFDSSINLSIQKCFQEIGHVFIADGHHRSASSSLLAKELKDNINAQYFLGAFFPENDLKIFSFHRLLTNLTIPNNLLEKLSEQFIIEEITSTNYPLKNKTIGMYWNNKRFVLKYKNTNDTTLDTEILVEHIFKKFFLLQDIRNNTHIHYYPEYTCSIHQAEEMVNNKKYQIAFFTHPASVQDIKNIALQNKTMPPKSTYVLPKLLNALVIYSLEFSMKK